MDIFSDFLMDCRQEKYWTQKDRLLLAISGGVDSMVLLDLFCRLPLSLQPEFAVVHINHQLRQQSSEEEAYLESYCKKNNLSFYSGKWEKSQHPTSGIELAARHFRYSFFQEVMHREEMNHLITAHHADDQLETILMRLVRGDSLESVAGIRQVRPFSGGAIVRPLLHYSKEDLYQYSREQGLVFFEDETNQSMDYTRNRYRHSIVPLLKEENARVLAHFAEFSSELQDLLYLTSELVKEKAASVCFKQTNGSRELNLARFLSFDTAMQRQVMRHLLQEIYQDTPAIYQKQQIEQVIQLMASERPNAQIDLPGEWTAQKSYEKFRFVKAQEKLEKLETPVSLTLGKWVELPRQAKMGLFDTAEPSISLSNNTTLAIYLRPEEVSLPLTIRNRAPGDRMSLKGTENGTKKVKDILIDQKVPLNKRDDILLVTDATGKIIWLVGYKESRLSITPETDTIQYILMYQQEKELY